MSTSSDVAALSARYAAAGLAARVGWGERHALIVVDLSRGFTDPECPLGSPIDDVVAAAGQLMDIAHGRGVPIHLTTVAYDDDLSDAGIWPLKIQSQHLLVRGSRWVEIDPRLPVRPEDSVIEKPHASAFFATDLASLLRADDIDTVVIAGATTSGCVRATAVDACAHGFRPIVVRQAVGDRHDLAHEVSLLDIDSRYGDVVDLDEALRTLGTSVVHVEA